jgi:hypothetical protein
MTPSATSVRRRKKLAARQHAHTASKLGWSLFSSHGNVVMYLALCPNSNVQQIARALGRTERAIARTVSALRRSGIVRARTVNRRKLFTINLDASLHHPTLRGYTLRQVFGNLREHLGDEDLDICKGDPSGE